MTDRYFTENMNSQQRTNQWDKQDDDEEIDEFLSGSQAHMDDSYQDLMESEMKDEGNFVSE